MPLTRDQRTVADSPQHLAKRGPVLHVFIADVIGIAAGKQRSSSRVALRGVVKLCESKPVLRQHVDIGRGQIRGIAVTDIVET